MKIETLYKEVRECLEYSVEDNELEDFLKVIVKGISDDAILRALVTFAGVPEATKDYELEERIERACGLDEALSELHDKCPMCFGSGKRPQ